MDDSAPHQAYPCGESYGIPMRISTVPRFANPRPSVRNSYDFCAMTRDGYDAISTEISSTTVQILIACRYPLISKFPCSSTNLIRLIDARLQAVSSRNIYSEQGLDALIRPSSGQVCH